jgi:integrase
MLLWLLSAARISEVILARADEVVGSVWTIPGDRVKNANPHRIPLGAWGQALVQTNSAWLFPSDRVDGPRGKRGWYNARNRVLSRMSRLAGRPICHWNPHDLRRTARSNTRRLGTDFETAEAMLNHVKTGLARTYDGYDFEDEKRAWFLAWENEIIRIARQVGVAEDLGVPSEEEKPAAISVARRVPPRRSFTTTRGSRSRRSPRRA